MKTIGLIGLGLLGSALAERLLGADFAVHGFDIDAGRRDNLERLGGTALQSAPAVAESSRRIVLSLPTSAIVSSVIAERGDALRPGTILIGTSAGVPEQHVS